MLIPRDIVRAYERTAYVVESDPTPFVLRIGEHSDALLGLHAAAGVACSAFVSACNPFGRRCAAARNAAAMKRLRKWLRDAGLRFIAGEGRGEDRSWPAEPSLLVLGMSADSARRLCVRFEQNAVLFACADAVPRLLFHPHAEIAARPSDACE